MISMSNYEAIYKEVNKFLKKFSRNTDIREDQNIYELGFANSIFTMQLMLFLEKEYNIDFSQKKSEFSNACTLGEIVRFISESTK